MAQRGRKSTGSMATKKVNIGIASRINTPLHLSDAEVSVWVEVVNDQPANAFTATHAPLLELYCRHIVQARIIADELLSFEHAWLSDDDGLKRYDTLLRMTERESRSASSLATRLRITRQAIDQQTVARTISNNPKTRKPWEIGLV